MNELLRRLRLQPWLCLEVIMASFFVNLLSLASTIYVILVLSRYVGYGFDGTLITLTAGVVLAAALSFGFSVVRAKLAGAVSLGPDEDLSSRVLGALSGAKSHELNLMTQARIQEVVNGLQMIQNAYDRNRIISALDGPFFILFILAIFFLSPLLCVITLFGLLFTGLNGWLTMRRDRVEAHKLQEMQVEHRGLVSSAVLGADTVRAFGARDFLRASWNEQLDRIGTMRKRLADKMGMSIAVTSTLSLLLRVAVYAVGAKLTVMGEISVSVLIGVSILAAKSQMMVSSFMQTYNFLSKADEKLDRLNEFLRLPHEQTGGVSLPSFSGGLELTDVAITYEASTGPVFESLSMSIEAGSILVVRGYNGSGKTTFARMLLGLLEPSRGRILVEGVELRQLDPSWWRGQLSYLPQEVIFLNATLRENIVFPRPDIEEEELIGVIQEADLSRFLETSRTGLEMQIRDGGRNLPLGIRRRIALARALVRRGRLAVFDDPTEGLDSHGCAAVYKTMNRLSQEGVTIVVMTNDPNIIKAAGKILDLSTKPVPRVIGPGELKTDTAAASGRPAKAGGGTT